MRSLKPFIYIMQRELRGLKFWVYVIAIIAMFYVTAKMNETQNIEVRRIPIALIDEDDTEISRLIVERIGDNDFIELKTYDDPMGALRRWQIDGIFILRQGFSEKLISGEKRGLIDFYYPPVYVTPEIIGEAVTKEVMRVYVTYRAIDFIRNEYEGRGMIFDDALEQSIRHYTDSFWEAGDTITIDVHYVSLTGVTGEGMEESGTGLRGMLINAVLSTLLLYAVLMYGISLVMQKESGLMTRVLLCNVNPVNYVVFTMLIPFMVSVLTVIFFFGLIEPIYILYIMWCWLISIFIFCSIKHLYSYLLLLSLTPLLFTGVAGLSFYLGESVVMGVVSPVYCVIRGEVLYLSVHILLLCILLFLKQCQQVKTLEDSALQATRKGYRP